MGISDSYLCNFSACYPHSGFPESPHTNARLSLSVIQKGGQLFAIPHKMYVPILCHYI